MSAPSPAVPTAPPSPAPVARTFLVRGLLAGVIAGLITFAAASLVGEPPVDAAIAIEEAAAAAGVVDPAAAGVVDPAPAGDSHADGAAPHSHDGEAGVSRAVQSTWGLATGTIVFGTALGGIVGLVTAFAIGRLGRLGFRGTALAVAAAGFVAVYLLPYLKYPPNPPAVGNPETIGARTGWYFAVVAVSVVAAITALVVARRLTPRLGAWTAHLLAAAGYVVVAGGTALLLPTVNEVAADFPASLLWDFRIASLVVQCVLWASLGLVLGALLQRGVRSTAAAPGSGGVGSSALTDRPA